MSPYCYQARFWSNLADRNQTFVDLWHHHSVSWPMWSTQDADPIPIQDADTWENMGHMVPSGHMGQCKLREPSWAIQKYRTFNYRDGMSNMYCLAYVLYHSVSFFFQKQPSHWIPLLMVVTATAIVSYLANFLPWIFPMFSFACVNWLCTRVLQVFSLLNMFFKVF